MADLITITGESKKEKYQSLIPQLVALVGEEPDLIANLSNLMAGLKQSMHFLWVGVYFVKEHSPTLSLVANGHTEKQLVLGPFQGSVACTRIAYGQGVCGTAWKEKKTLIVPDVDQFVGHIACSSESKSEIVLPGFNTNGEVIFVLDVDSSKLNDFDKTDELYLKQVIAIIEKIF